MVVCQYFLKGDCRFGDRCRYEHPSAEKKTVCSFFLNGYCRFGDKCHNEHPRNGGSQGFTSSSGPFGRLQSNSRANSQQWSSSSHRNQNRFEVLSNNDAGQHSRPSDGEQQISQIQQTVQNDMTIWERSGQWPLSCYTFTKEEPCFQGLLDFSPEEIRLEAYTANAKGSADGYERGLKQLISNNQNRRHHLSRMSVSQIQEEIKKSSRPHEAVSLPSTGPRAGLFGIVSDGTLSSFSNSSNGNSSDVKSSGLFKTNKSNSQSGLFGQTNVSPSNSQTVFNSSPTPGSVFGNSNSSNNPGTLFGINNQTSSIIDTSKQSGNLFGVSSTNQAFSSVSPAALASSHGTVSTQASKPQTGNNIGPESQSMPPTTLKSNTTSSSSSDKSSSSPSERQTLTCSEQDMQAFMADSFILGKIPECPPPLELC